MAQTMEAIINTSIDRGRSFVYRDLADGNDFDAGDIIVQEKIKVRSNDSLYSLYKESYNLSVNLTLEALKRIESKEVFPIKNQDVRAPYYSFPNAWAIKNFSKNGHKIIWGDKHQSEESDY